MTHELGKTTQYLSNLFHLSHNNYHLRSSDIIILSIPKAHTAKIPAILLQQVNGTPFNTPLNFQLFHHFICFNRKCNIL